MRRRLRYLLLALTAAIGGTALGIDQFRDAGTVAADATTVPADVADPAAAASEADAAAVVEAADAAGETDPADAAAEDTDREIFRASVDFASEHGLADAPIGDAIAAIGRTFVGTPYVPHVLEAPGPERLIVNLRELDCVTFVENMLSIARVVGAGAADFDAFTDELRSIRYRGGEIDGYASRLHYFSEWIADAERKGIVRDVTRELGGVPDPEPIDFMSTHPDAYRQLADPATLDTIRGVEAALNERTRYVIPQSRIADVAPRIREGDIIAATSAVEGLDVAHTGIAVRVDGELHLMHAPLVGRSVEISDEPLADRIRGIDGQDGIMIARPLS